MKKIFLALILLFGGVFLFMPQSSKADNGVTVYAPSTGVRGRTIEIDMKIQNHAGEIYHLYISDCNGNYQDKKGAVDLKTNNDYRDTYMWDTAQSGTEACVHNIVLKTFTTDGTMTAKDERDIVITNSGTSSSSSSSSGGSSDGGDVNVHAPSSAAKGSQVDVNIRIDNHAGEIYHLFIADCDGQYQDKTGAVDLHSNNNYSTTYKWDTAAAGTESCSHNIVLKVFSTDGSMTAKDETSINITSSGSSSGSGSSGGSSSGGSGPQTIHTRFGDFKTLPEYITAIYNKALPYGISIVILTIIYSGYILMTSAGSPEAATNAKNYIILSLSGLVLLILAKLVIDAIWAPF